MKNVVLLAFLLACCTLGALAQNAGGYEITHIETYDQTKLISALDKCRFDNYRKYDQRVTLTFEDGSTVALLSIKEMQNAGLACDLKIVTPDNHVQNNVFILHPDGFIVEQVNREANSLAHKKYMLEKQSKKP